jgi:site-specific DNA-methyltransferase (cytosine-N4-specific)
MPVISVARPVHNTAVPLQQESSTYVIRLVSYCEKIICVQSVLRNSRRDTNIMMTTTMISSDDDKFRLYCGDALTILKENVETESVDCVITSPPYWQKRDNGVYGQIGLEPLYTEYIEKLWQVFAEVKRVLKRSGTCWVVIDDTSNGNKRGNTNGIPTTRGSGTVKQKEGLRELGAKGVNKKTQQGIPEYSLLQIPHRFSIGMTDRLGWGLSNEIIWYKWNGQPNTAKTRCTYGYDERIFLFVKSHEDLYFVVPQEPSKTDPSKMIAVNQIWPIQTEQSKEKHYSAFPLALCNRCIDAGCPPSGTVLDPFVGSGTTGIAALQKRRAFIGIDISKEYIDIAKKRLDMYGHYHHHHQDSDDNNINQGQQTKLPF